MDKLIIGGQELESRLFIGTGKFPSKSVIPEVIEACKTEVVTMALRRVDIDSKDEKYFRVYTQAYKFTPKHIRGSNG